MSNKQLTKIFDNFVKSFVTAQHYIVVQSRQFREKKKRRRKKGKEKRSNIEIGARNVS